MRFARFSTGTWRHRLSADQQDLESAQIEISALRSALQSLRAQGIAVLTHEDTLPIGESRSAMPSTAPKAEQLEEAFNKLAAQSREVAKIRRAN